MNECEDENKLPEYNVARFAFNGALFIVAVPNIASADVFAAIVTFVCHSVASLMLNTEAFNVPPEVPI